MRTKTALCASLLLAGAAYADDDDWSWNVTPYAWATDVGVQVGVDDRQVLDHEIPISEIMDDLDWTTQVHVEAQRRAHGVLFDLFDVDLSSEDQIAVPQAGGATAAINSDIGMTIADLGGIYDPRGDRQGFSLVYGTRVIQEEEKIDAWFTYDPSRVKTYEGEDTLVDGLFGIRYTKRLSNRLSLLSRADVSAGETDHTWSMGGALDYALGKTGRYSATVGYRRMVFDFEDEDGIDTDMDLSGAFVGLRISF
jgi:hypothetical protein